MTKSTCPADRIQEIGVAMAMAIYGESRASGKLGKFNSHRKSADLLYSDNEVGEGS